MAEVEPRHSKARLAAVRPSFTCHACEAAVSPDTEWVAEGNACAPADEDRFVTCEDCGELLELPDLGFAEFYRG